MQPYKLCLYGILTVSHGNFKDFHTSNEMGIIHKNRQSVRLTQIFINI